MPLLFTEGVNMGLVEVMGRARRADERRGVDCAILG
jgi:hypothetical protein